MKKVVAFLLFAFCAALDPLHAQQQQPTTVSERNPPVITMAQYFQSRLEKLYQAINDKQNDNIIRYQSDLTGAMRNNMSECSKTGTQKEYAQRKEEIIQKFDGFTFVNATKDESDAHLAILEEFLAMIQ